VSFKIAEEWRESSEIHCIYGLLKTPATVEIVFEQAHSVCAALMLYNEESK